MIPVNCPVNGLNHYQRDGFMNVSKNGGDGVNYEKNSHGGPVEDNKSHISDTQVSGVVSRKDFEKTGDIDFEQPRQLWAKVMT